MKGEGEAPQPSLPVTVLLFEPFELWWAEQQDPAMADHPLVSVLNERVVHANSAAHNQGITPGLTLSGARLKAGGLNVIEAGPGRLGVQWSWQLKALSSWSPWLHSPQVGRVWLHASEAEARQLAVGQRVRAGVAAFREIALAAALVTRPGEHRLVPNGTEREFLAQLPTSRLPSLGLSREATVRFTYLGVRNLGDLFHWSEVQLRSIVGGEAAGLHTLLQGPWEPRVPRYRPPRSLSASHGFADPVMEPHRLEPAVRRIASRLVTQLGGLVSSRVIITTESLGLRLPDEGLPKEPLCEEEELVRLVWRSLQKTGAASLGIERLSVTLVDLTRPQAQPSLWPAKQERERAIRAVSRRFPGALLAFEQTDPYSLARERRYRLYRLDTGETVAAAPPVTIRVERKHAQTTREFARSG